jgi:hypothetical protein
MGRFTAGPALAKGFYGQKRLVCIGFSVGCLSYSPSNKTYGRSTRCRTARLRSEAPMLLDKGELAKKRAVFLEALGEATDGDADGIVMHAAG